LGNGSLWSRGAPRALRIGSVVAGFVLCLALGGSSSIAAPSAILYPDLLTVVPGQVVTRTREGVSHLLFTNVIANMGTGPLQILGVHSATITIGYQQLLNASGQVAVQFPVSTFEFHPQHRHWHIDNVAEYKLRAGGLDGAVVAQFTKVTFCLIDTERLVPKTAAGPRTYFGCNVQLQGITNGWGDEYIRGLPGQELPITGLPTGVYYLVSTADPGNNFVETNDANNAAWVKIQLFYVSGLPRVTVLDHSPCEGVLCGDVK